MASDAKASVSTTVQLLTIDNDEQEEHPATHTSVLLIFIHGAFTANDRYLPLLRAIQHSCLQKGVKLDIGYGTYPHHIPNKEQTEEIISQLNSKSNSNAYDAKFIAGHSMGALVGTELALSSSYDGLIHLCSSFQFHSPVRSLASYPKPVLTLVGCVDGFMKYYLLSKDMDDLEKEIENNYTDDGNGYRDMDLSKPIIIQKDINHMQSADDVVGEALLQTFRHDFDSTLKIEEAHEIIAKAIASFILITTLRPSKLLQKRSDEYEMFMEACKFQSELTASSREMVRSFRSLSSESFIADLARDMQRSIANLQEELVVVPNFHETKEDFLYSKPMILESFANATYSKTESNSASEREKTISTLHIHLVPQDSIQWHKNLPSSTSQQSPTYAIKAKSQDSLLSSYTKQGKPITVSEFNKRSFDQVWNEYLTDEQQLNYKEKGRKLEFGSDIFITSAPAWVDTPLQIIHSENVTVVQSPFTLTAVDNECIPLKFRGMFYAKPMTPSQIYEWIVYDTFRIIPPSLD